MKISDFGAFGTAECVVRGKTVRVAAFSAAKRDAIYAVFPRPQPPLVPDPTRGSLAPKIADTKDPAYIEAVVAWDRLTTRVELAIAMGLVLRDGREYDPANVKAWGEAAAAELAEHFTQGELRMLLEAYEKAVTGLAEDARGN